MTRLLGVFLVAVAALGGLLAPWLAPHSPDRQFPALLNAPPTMPHIIGDGGRWRAPFIYRWTLVDRLEQRFEQNRSAPVPLVWFAGGRLIASADEVQAPLLLAGADSFGRDVFARLLFGARTSLGLALTASAGALLLGLVAGGVAGFRGGAIDEALMRLADFVLVLPAIYVVLALRAVLPLVLEPRVVFLLLAGIFAIVGAPFVARGVRAIVRAEARLDYAAAAESLGAGPWRLLVRHLMPATRGFLVVQLTILVPAFVVAEATLSYVGLGLPDPIASWGAMLHEGTNVRAFADFPWLLSPAAAIVLVVLGLNLVLQSGSEGLNYNVLDEETLRRFRSDSDAVRS